MVYPEKVPNIRGYEGVRNDIKFFCHEALACEMSIDGNGGPDPDLVISVQETENWFAQLQQYVPWLVESMKEMKEKPRTS